MTGSQELLQGRIAAALVFVSSGAVLVLEIVGLRLVAPYVGVTLQTSSAIIGVALAAIAYGAWFGGFLADRLDPRRLLAPALLLAAGATALTLPIVRWAGELLRGSAAAGVLLLAMMALFVPAALLSAVTPLVVKLQLSDLSRTGTVVGQLSGVGTVGGITATLTTGFVLVATLSSSTIVLGLAGLLAAVGIAMAGYLRSGAVLRGPTGLYAVVLGLAGAGLTAFAPAACDVETAYHCARITVDPARESGRILWLNTVQNSYVDVDDPKYLKFEYVQTIGSLLDVVAPAGAPVDTLHLGAGGLTLPGYLAATRSGSRSRVMEIDGKLLALDRARLPAPVGLETWTGDARLGVTGQPDDAWSVVVGDAFGDLAVPWHLTTREFVAQIRRVLRPGGVYALNVIDGPARQFVRAETATLTAQFPHVAVVAPPHALAGQGTGSNFVLLASPAALPLDALRGRLAERGTPVSIMAGRDFAAGAKPLTDDYAPVDQLLGR
jgi:MFS family permease